jgi:hypothetical protein
VNHALYLLDPEPAPAWAPFAGIRPLCELRAGAHLVRERWETFVGAETTAIFALPHLAGFPEAGVPPVEARHAVVGPALIGSSTFAPRGLAAHLPDAPVRLTHDGITVGWAVPAGVTWDGPLAKAQATPVEGVLLRGVYDLLTALEQLLHEDVLALLDESSSTPAAGRSYLKAASRCVPAPGSRGLSGRGRTPASWAARSARQPSVPGRSCEVRWPRPCCWDTPIRRTTAL